MSVEQVLRPPWIHAAAAQGRRDDEPGVQPRRVLAQVIDGALVVLLAVGLNNHHRHHTAIGGPPPAARVPHLCGQYT